MAGLRERLRASQLWCLPLNFFYLIAPDRAIMI